MAVAMRSPHAVGLSYELLAVRVLEMYSFRLAHTGGRGDRGADFIGHWVLPSRSVPVMGQCKCHRKSVGPASVREFESVLLRRSQSSGVTYTGVLISHSWFSPSALKLFLTSHCPLILCQIEPAVSSSQQHKQEGYLTECALNRSARCCIPEVLVTSRLSVAHSCGGLQRKTVTILVSHSQGSATQSLLPV